MTQQSAKSSALANIMQTQYQNEMSFQNKVRETEYAQQVARDSMNDPYTAIPQMIEEYKKLGIPFTRSTQQIIQDFESSGKDLATYLSELQGTIQSKPEFKRYQELQQ
jgi:glucose-6-phosphate 1-dehydrogenase